MLPIRFAVLAVVVSIVLISPSPSFASNGLPFNGTIPPTAEGPGFFLPDSPFFFLDQLKQSIRLTMAVSPQAKARVYSSIAGERFAELRFMLAAKNTRGTAIALGGVADNMQMASKSLEQAKFNGGDVKQLASLLTESIKTKQHVLDSLESQSTGVLKAQTTLALASLSSTKESVVRLLPQDQLASETQSDLQHVIEKQLGRAQAQADHVDTAATLLAQQVTATGQEAIAEKEKILHLAQLRQNVQQIMEAQVLLDAEKAKQQAIQLALQKSTTAAQTALADVQNAQQQYAATKTLVANLQQKPLQDFIAAAIKEVAGAKTVATKSGTLRPNTISSSSAAAVLQ